MLLVLNKINKESSAGANITKIQQGGGDNVHNLSTPNATSHNVGSHFETVPSEIKTVAEDGKTPRTRKKL